MLHSALRPAFHSQLEGGGHGPQPAREASAYLVVVVAQGSAQLVVIHVGFVLAESPQFGHFFCLEELEFTIVGRPADQMLVFLVQQQLQQELPQRDCTLHTWGEGRTGQRVGGPWCPRAPPPKEPNRVRVRVRPDRSPTQAPPGYIFVNSHDAEIRESPVVLARDTHPPASGVRKKGTL